MKLFPYAAALLLVHPLAACSSEEPSNGTTAAAPDPATSATPAPAAAAAVADGKLVLAFGDSLYAGYGVAEGESFPAELEKALKARGIAARVANAGVNGDTTAGGLQRLAFTLDGLPRKPDLAVVGLGGNDMLRGIDPAQVRANLSAICAELKRRGIPIVLTGMVAAPNLGADYARAFNAIYPDLAKQHDAPLYPFFLEGVVTDAKLMQPDRIHPTAEGIDAVTGKVAPVVAGVLE